MSELDAAPRIGIFGGGFDPPHLGHRAVAEATDARHRFTELLWIPTGDPPHKPGRELAGGAHRAAMCRLAIRDRPTWVVDERELRRAGTSYTKHTIRELRAEHGAEAMLFLLVGADQLALLHTWSEVRNWIEDVRVVAVRRGEDELDRVLGPGSKLSVVFESWSLRQSVFAQVRRDQVAMPLHPASSTELRRVLATGATQSSWLDPEVRAYIEEHRLYRTRDHDCDRRSAGEGD